MAEETKLKIVVFGAFGAGKTTLIKTIDPESKHIEANCTGGTTTVALDFGRIQKDECHIHIFGTPGQERFEFAREIIATGMDGGILLIDATTQIDVGANPEIFSGQFGSSEIRKVSAINRRQCVDAVLQFAGRLPPHPNGHHHKSM
jgi:signal recognition particle receptor subunit beta